MAAKKANQTIGVLSRMMKNVSGMNEQKPWLMSTVMSSHMKLQSGGTLSRNNTVSSFEI